VQPAKQQQAIVREERSDAAGMQTASEEVPISDETTAASSQSSSTFHRLAVVEVQLILQYCDLTTLLRLAGTSRAIRRAADAAHVWEHRTPLTVTHVGHFSPHHRAKDFEPACFSAHAILLRRYPLVAHFLSFSTLPVASIRHAQLHIVDLRLVHPADGSGGSPAAVAGESAPSLDQLLRDESTNWRIRALITSVRLEEQNAALLENPTHRAALQTVTLHADRCSVDDPRVRDLLEEQLRSLENLRTLVLCSHAAIASPSLAILATFDHLTSLRLETFQDDVILEFLFFTRGPLFASLESLELYWIAPMGIQGVEQREMETRRDGIVARIEAGGSSVSLAHFVGLERLKLEGAGLSPVLLPRLHTMPHLHSLCYHELIAHSHHWGSGFPEPSILLSALQRNRALEVEFTAWQAPASVRPFVEMAHPRVLVVTAP
jgi:hypothetical protein